MSNQLKINGKILNKAKVLNLIEKNSTIEAVKYVKDETNLSLKDSKDIVDNLLENPEFYGGAENTIIEPTITERNLIVKNKERNFKGSHVLKNKQTKAKNSIIIFLLIVVLILTYFLLK
ncbi:hypothetical protein [Lacinutrix sp. MedPE-SW]|uniref:hypothetical protein n=1 Tax=Lacinutrix sp. MedPE-SW TaxID=1860087 RepID=UPI00091E69C6|nr:hypothetical protein [Lacinutrix sp. MedPE-SW]OIQ22795.1 MAG: hypothetical protein BM549_06855 [Lacinutrix sp. MedPE-SW]